MRSSQKSGRSRGKGNRPNKAQGHSPNRVYESAGPEGKVRGTPQQIIDKYLALARDAQLSGDRVGSENFLQHAEHYARILITAAEAAAERREQQGGGHQPQGGQQHHNQPQQQGGGQQPNPSRGQSGGPDERAGDGAGQEGAARRPDVTSEPGEQPESDGLAAIDAASGQADIVDTPESRAEPRQRRPRQRSAAAPQGEAVAAAEGSPEPEAGADAEKRKRKPRAPRRAAKSDEPAAPIEAASTEAAGDASTEAAE